MVRRLVLVVHHRHGRDTRELAPRRSARRSRARAPRRDGSLRAKRRRPAGARGSRRPSAPARRALATDHDDLGPHLDGKREGLGVVAGGQHHLVSPLARGRARPGRTAARAASSRGRSRPSSPCSAASSSPASARKVGAVVQRTNGTRFVHEPAALEAHVTPRVEHARDEQLGRSLCPVQRAVTPFRRGEPGLDRLRVVVRIDREAAPGRGPRASPSGRKSSRSQ